VPVVYTLLDRAHAAAPAPVNAKAPAGA